MSRNLRKKSQDVFHKVVLIYPSKMPHSEFKNRHIYLDEGVSKCPYGQAFIYVSERDFNVKLWLHCKVCTETPEGSKRISKPKKAMTLKEAQLDKAERMKRFHKHH